MIKFSFNQEHLAGYHRADRIVLLCKNENAYLYWKWICVLFFQERPRKMMEDWEISKDFNLLKNLSQKLHEDLFDELEEFVCFLCVAYVTHTNNAWWKKTNQKLQRGNKLTNFTSSPPCKYVLLYGAKQTNGIAYM